MNLDPMTLLGGSRLRQVLTTAIAVLLGLLVGGVLMILSGFLAGKGWELRLPLDAYAALFRGSLGSERSIANTLTGSVPYVLAGLAIAFGFRAGLFNIGAQGQFLLGAFTAAVVGAQAGIPPLLHLPLAVIAGTLAGAAWGFIPGFLKAHTGAHEVVTTIMLNSVAALVLNWAASDPFRDPGASFPRTADVLGPAVLPIIVAGTRLHAGFLIALAMVLVAWFLLFRTTLGFEIRTVGANASAARYAGIRPALIIVLTMCISGGLAGLAGVCEILGITRNYPAEYSNSFGFDAIAVALLGRAHPLGVLLAGLLFAILRTGAATMQRSTEIGTDIISIIQGAIILFVAAEVLFARVLPARRRGPSGGVETPVETTAPVEPARESTATSPL